MHWIKRASCALLLAQLVGCGLNGTGAAFNSPKSSVSMNAQSVRGVVKRHANVTSKVLSKKRDVWVYLPPGYDKQAQRRYPVLYLHDGNNCFDGSQSFGGHEWEIDESADRLIRSGEVAPFIAVGVGNTADRLDEYTWEADANEGGGKGKLYARFLTEELKPFIDKTYRTLPDRDNTALMGSSLGGLINIYLGRYYSGVYGKVAVMSPSIYWASHAVLEDAEQMPENLKIWLDIGTTEEGGTGECMEDVRTLKGILEGRGYREGDNLGYFEDPIGGHNEQAWAFRAPMAMKFLFGS